MIKGSLIILLLLCLLPRMASAEDMEITVFGHKLVVYAAEHEVNSILKVDGKELVRQPIVAIKEIGSFANTGFVIGITGPEGNNCDGSVFILSFVEGAPPRIDGPLDVCSVLSWKVDRDRIVVEDPAFPKRDGSRWTWTVNGFGPPEKLKFAGPGGKGWSALQNKSIGHPGNLLRYKDFTTRLSELLGQARYKSLNEALAGPGSAQYDGDVFVGDACQAHACPFAAAIIAIDISSQKVAVALKYGDNPLFVAPPEADWPDAAKSHFREWRAKN